MATSFINLHRKLVSSVATIADSQNDRLWNVWFTDRGTYCSSLYTYPENTTAADSWRGVAVIKPASPAVPVMEALILV